MIVKSKSRKVGNFDQLYDYMKKGAEKHDGVHVFSQNIYSHNRDGILKEFSDNAALFRKRKNSVYLYHEIISITRSQQLSVTEQQEALFHIVHEYIENRAKNNLVCGYMHNDAQNNIHYHVMISSNERGKTKNLRLSKKEFDESKKHLETWTNKKYPELKQGLVINKQAGKKTSHNGTELKKRTGKMPERERVTNALKSVFTDSENKQNFFNNLATEHLEVYIRGKHIGFTDIETGRKYRLKTLGLSSEFNEMSKKIELDEKQKQAESDNKQQYKDAKGQKESINKVEPESPVEKQKSKVRKAVDELQKQRSKNSEHGKKKT
ncbi:hypothetical protein KO527_10780 [Pseudoalteromonas sp. C2R02]|uniref:relaxase/mobilization nuclease domain-containing protein n=1 Tax=Pseudoalteromonas sp. C2R02 TaxID=2841565 RepID=UPI001C09AE12|nr:hypothetical protein [Pseudoalteromonas sp. C2R02]MBU2969831.1 hypothetical protein [Pseudoalteromonas sp. C2R02]